MIANWQENHSMADILTTFVGSIGYLISTKYEQIRDWMERRQGVPLRMELDDGRPPAIVVSFSQDVADDVKIQGFNVIAQIGTPKKLSTKEITRWSEGAAAIIEQMRRGVSQGPLTVALSCPVAAAFTIGLILGHSAEYRILHWDGKSYVPLEFIDMDRFRKSL